MSVYCFQVLQDAILENQTEASFVTSAAPKAVATCHLDELSRQMCPHLRHFVVFSSIVCGRGNAGQSNYGMSNSIMERICEARVRDGFPGIAIQWAAVGDVGLVAEKLEKHINAVIGQLCFQDRDMYVDQTFYAQTLDTLMDQLRVSLILDKQTNLLCKILSFHGEQMC
jgi:hypothetical protein